MADSPQLVLIEWVDSGQPIPGWQWLADLDPRRAHKCVSVGFLVQDDETTKVLAPNLGSSNGDDDWDQASGLTTIPSAAVTKIERLSAKVKSFKIGNANMPYGLNWSETFVRQLSDKEVRDEFVADQVRSRIAALIRVLREQEDRKWTQTELGRKANKPQNVISRYEDPDYGKMSLQTLLEVAAAFDLPVWVDIPEWDDWFAKIRDFPNSATARESFNLDRLAGMARAAKDGVQTGSISNVVGMARLGDCFTGNI